MGVSLSAPPFMFDIKFVTNINTMLNFHFHTNFSLVSHHFELSGLIFAMFFSSHLPDISRPLSSLVGPNL